MAKIAIATYGTTGDVQPVLGLGTGLAAAGHDVTLYAPPDTLPESTPSGMSVLPLGDPMKPAVAAAPDPRKNRVDSDKGAFAFLRQQISTQLETLAQSLDRPDMLLAAQLAWGAASVAERTGIPYRYIAYTPQAIPSSRYPPIVSRTPGAPGWLHSLTWRMYCGATNIGFKKLINGWRSQHDLPPLKSVWEHVLGEKVLLACDPIFGTHPMDGVPKCVQVGFLPAPMGPRHLSDGVQNFLDAGEQPIYAGFGSMPGGNAEKSAASLVAAARGIGRRLLLGGGWGQLALGGESDDVLQIGFEPFSLLFERVAAVVHHGGAGTTATAARAGAPQLIVPHLGDQFFFAHRVWKIGLGPKPIPLRKMNSGRLTAALKQIEAETRIKKTANELAETLKPCDGVRGAVEAIEEDLQHLGRVL